MKDGFKHAMSRFANAISIVTSVDDNGPVGLVATSVCSLSAEPPSILVCVNKNASAHNAILASNQFAISLPTERQQGVVTHFMTRKGAERFDSAHWLAQPGQSPVLSDASVAIRCTLETTYDGFSHTILIGVISKILLGEDQACLLWKSGQFHSSQGLPS